MEIDLEQAFDGPVDLSHRFDVPLERLDRPELLSLDAVEFAGRLERIDGGFLLEGRLRLAGSAACSRCLTPVPFSRDEDVSWTFAPAHSRNDRGEDEELSEGDLDVVFYDELRVALDPLVDEQLQLAIPMKPLCREDCKGICPSCGADLNAAACACRPAAAGSLATGLKNLLPSN